MSRCTNFYARHWFVIRGTTGLRSPACTRCGAPNPRPLKDEEWRELIGYREGRGYPYADPIEAAIAAHLEMQS